MEMYCGIPEDIYGEGLLRVVSIPGLIYICSFSLTLIIVNAHIYLLYVLFLFFFLVFNSFHAHTGAIS